jgi:lambda repressor-like predicted transcriptional regulator
VGLPSDDLVISEVEEQVGEVCEGGTTNRTKYTLKEHIRSTLMTHMSLNGQTLRGLERHLGLSRGTVDWTLKGSEEIPKLSRVIEIADALGLDVEVTFKRRVQ